ncbi:hypothetical protein GGX14DRAFT_560164 [Mycena pura]|uniref:Uncharacterized protein n=1 Tax=Mycena pura TaxID=153505 RepID=A0AAD6VT38_9AGAR|nr:hypothetical protein GGX14DRAFT_560164 [Mycena pura]
MTQSTEQNKENISEDPPDEDVKEVLKLADLPFDHPLRVAIRQEIALEYPMDIKQSQALAESVYANWDWDWERSKGFATMGFDEDN